MSGCDFQLTSHNADRGTTVHIRAVWLALALSLVVHVGAGYFAGGVVMEASGAPGRSAHLASSGPVMVLDFEPPPLATETSKPSPPPAVAAHEPEPKPVAPPPLEPDTKLKLGIAESDQKSPNWLGFNDPTPHSAPKSEVEQPALDPNAGRPGEPAPATPPTPPVAADPMETPVLLPPIPTMPVPPEEVSPNRPVLDPTSAPLESPTEPQPPTTPPEILPPAPPPPVQVPPTTPPGDALEMIESQRPKLGEPEPLTDPPAAPNLEPTAPLDPNLPALAEGFVGPLPRELVALLEAKKQRGERSGARDSAADRARDAVHPRSPTPTGTHPTPARPAHPPVPGGPAPSASRPAAPNTPSGNNADRDAELSEKQSDATALAQTIDIRPGRPAASQGLDIVTRRPNFTRLTRVVAWPDNPLLRVTFGRTGLVVKVELLESSGASEIDDPVINAIYQWTARGKALDELPNEHSTLTANVRIILR